MQNSTTYCPITKAQKATQICNQRMMTIITSLVAVFFLMFTAVSQTTLISPTGAGGFESGATVTANGWVSTTGQVNQWFVGSVAVPSAGTNSAYISSSPTGATYDYNIDAASVSHIYKDVTVPPGESVATLSFKWKANGEPCCDYLRVWIFPTSFTPVAGTQVSGGLQIGGNLNAQTTYQTVNFGGGVTGGSTYRLIFEWKNDGSLGPAPGASIDEVQFITSAPASFTANPSGGLWSSPATWSGGVVPGTGNDVTIPAGSIVTVDQVTNYRDLTIAGTVQWNATSNAMTVGGNLTINSGGNLFAYTTAGTGQTINIGGNFANNGFANLALPSALINFNGSGSTLSGTGTFQGNGTDGIIRSLSFQNLGSNSVSTAQNIITSSLTHNGGSLSTGGKLKVDNTAQVYGLPLNLEVASVAVTALGTGYTAVPVVFGASVIQYANGLGATLNSRYVSGNNVYLCTGVGPFNSTPPTSTATTPFNTSGPTLLYIGTIGQLGNPYQITAVTLGTQYAYNGNLYTCTVAGTPGAAGLPPTHTSGTAASGGATFRYVGTAATATVNYDGATQTVRSLNLASTGSGYTSAPSIAFSVGVAGGGGSGAAATAVYIQQVAGPGNSLFQKSGGGATISGVLNINSDQGAGLASANEQASSGVGAISTSNGGNNYTIAPTVGFALPTALNLITNPGSGYTTTPTVTVTGGNLVTGSALTTSNFTIAVNQGTVQAVYLNASTTATYSTLPTLTLTASPGVTATLEFPAGCLPTAVANIGANGQLTSFTMTNAGFGYVAAPTVGIGTTSGSANGGTFTTVASAPTARIALYNLTLGLTAPSTTAVVNADDAAIPANRKLNNLSLAGNANGLNLTNGNITLFGTSPLSLTASSATPGNVLNLGGSNLLFTWNSYGGTGGTYGASKAYVTNGSISLIGRGGASTFTYPFAGSFVWFAGSTPTAVTTGSTVTKLTVTETAAPSGGAMGTRAFLANNNGGIQGLNPTVQMNFNAIDALTGNLQDLYIGQSAALGGPWVPRSVSSGSGAITGTGSRTTATAAPGPLVPTGTDYFAWLNILVDTANVTVQPPTCVASSHLVSAELTTSAGSITGVTITYNNGTSTGPLAMANTGGNTWQYTIPAATPSNALVTWSITATNTAGISRTFVGSSYRDDALNGVTATATATPATVCSGSPVSLSGNFAMPGSARTVGTGSTSSSSTAASFFPGSWGGAKTQYIIRGSELLLSGLASGPITSLAFETTAAAGQTYDGFTVQIGATTQTTMTTALITTPMTQVYKGTEADEGFTPANGINTLAFGTGAGSSSSFVWDGSTNIVISICWSSVPNASTASSTPMKVDPAGYTSSAYEQSDNSSPAVMCGKTVADGTGSNRPMFRFIGNAAVTFPTYTWNDGSTDVGNGNPLIVNPSITTTYTVTATDVNGCEATSAPVTVTTTALPNAPNANNSTQCGTGVSGAFVTSGFTSGSTGAFRWYDAQTGGTLLQTNGATFAGSISSTTSFWVSETDGTCESVRTNVIASVNQPDAIGATVNNNNPCTNTAITLSVSNIAGSPSNTYTYSWTAIPAGAASGLSVSTPGNPISVTPTAPGTYQYVARGEDGDCITTDTVTVTVRALPVLNDPTATPQAICAGESSTLTASTISSASSTVQVGNGTTELGGSTAVGALYGTWYGNGHAQILVKGTELTALGFLPGNLTGLSIDITALNGGDVTTLNGYTIKLAQVSTATTAITTFQPATFTTVWGPTNYTPVVGNNSHPFTTPFAWDGTSNIIVDYCFESGLVGTVGSHKNLYTVTSFGSFVNYNVDNVVSGVCANTTVSNASSNRPNIKFTGQVGAAGPGTLSYTWNPGNLSGSSVIVSPVSTTIYTVTATDPATTCSTTDTVSVTVYDLPAAPSGNGSEHCGSQVPAASVSSNTSAVSPVFNWYSAPTGGTLLQSGTSNTYLTAVSSTTNFYVAEISEQGCEGTRALVTVTVIEADAVSAASTLPSVCLGGSIDLLATQVGDNNSYAYSWTASPEAGSGLSGSTDGNPLTGVTPATAGSYTYTVTAFDADKGCQATASVTVMVNPLPAINSITATPSTVCAGADVVLNASSSAIAAGSATLGAGGTTTSGSAGTTPFYGGYGGVKTQYLIRASELTALGFVAGNITSLGIDLSSAGATLNGFTISMGNTALTALTGTIENVSTVVYATTFVPVLNVNTFNFSTPFNWNGSSNIIISFCWSNNNSSNTVSNVRGDNPGFVSGNARYVDSRTAAEVCGYTGSTTPSGWNGSSTSVSTRPKFIIAGQKTTNISGSYTWTWNPGNLTGSTVTVNPTTTTIYSVVATNASTGCSSVPSEVTVNVNPLSAAPIGTNSTQCGTGVPTASVATGGANGNGTFNWYANASGGTPLQSSTSSTYTTSISNTTTFYVSENGTNGCEGPRTAVTVTVTTPDPISTAGSGPAAVCLNSTVTLAASSSAAYVYTWTASPVAGSGIPTSATGASVTITPTVAGTYVYTVTGVDNSGPNTCTTSATFTATINPNPVITSATANPAVICAGGSVELQASSILPLPGSATLGAGASTSSSGGTPFYGGWGGTKVQYIYTAAELTAAGIVAGNINSVALNVTAVGTTYKGFAVSIGATTQGVFATANTLPVTQVYAGPLTDQGYLPTIGLNTFVFTSPFNWDGTSNIVVSFCYSNTNTSNSASTIQTDTYGTNVSMYIYSDNQTPATVCGATTTIPASGGSSTSTIRPRTTFNAVVNTDVTANYIWVWNPGNTQGNPITVTPTTSTDYSVTATSPGTGCSSTFSPVSVTVTPVAASASATPATPVCAGTSVTLNANPSGGAPFGISWSDGTSVVGTTNPLVVTPVVTTTYTVTVTDACSNTTTSSVTVNVNQLPTANIVETGPITLCFPATQVLTASTNAIVPTYQWTRNGVNITTGGTGATYTVTGPSTGTYRVIVTETESNCPSLPSAGVDVTINAQPSAVTITPATSTICNGSSQVLTASGGTTGGAGNATIGTATTLTSATTQPTAFCNRWPSYRMQTLYTAAELAAAGIQAGSNITSMAFTITTNGDGTTNPNYTVKVGASALTVMSGNFVSTASGFTTVYPAATYTHAIGVNVIPFSTPFSWNGTSNIIVEVMHDGADALNNSETYYTATPTNMVAYTTTNASNSASFSTQRLNVTFGYSSLQQPTWSWAGPGLNTTTGASVIASPSSTDTYTATATSAFGCTNSGTAVVTVNPRPTGVISGGASYCEGQSTTTSLSIAVTGSGPWSGTLSDGTAFSGASSPISVSVTPTTTTTYTVATLTDALCSAIAADLTGSATITVNPLAANPTATVVQPTCTVATGTINVTSPLGAGTTYSLDNGPFQSGTSFPGVASGTHTLAVQTSSGCFSAATTTVTVDPQPFTPTAPVITGIVNVCPHIGTTDEITYQATSTGNGTTTFNWVVPTTNVTVVSGQGTATLTLRFNTGFAAQANKQLRVTATNQCGTSPMTIYYLVAQLPTTPNPIAGPTDVCPFLGGPTQATYTITKAPGAASYIWTAQSGTTTISHPNGAGANDTTITVLFAAGFTTSSVTVQAVNDCGVSGVRSLTVTRNAPSTPSLISGPTNVCANIAPNGTPATYTVAAIAGVTYTWTAPAGATGQTGQGTNTFSFTYPAGFASGTVSVTATTGCGTSAPRNLSVTKLNPATPSVIDVIQTGFCGDPGGRVYTYTLASMPANATSILWTVPTSAGAILVSGQGTTSITVSYPNTAVAGLVTAQGQSNCGSSTTRATEVKLPACPPVEPPPPGFSKVAPSTKAAMEVKVFPNPTVNDFKLEVRTAGKEEINVRVLDGQGRMFKAFTVMPYQTISVGAELKAGSYLVEVRQGREVKTTKLIKF